jgi:hypothetical protein
MPIDWVLLGNRLIGGAISLAFGIVGGFVGSWISDYFERRRERDSKELMAEEERRQALVRGVSDLVYQQSKEQIEKQRRLFSRPAGETQTPSQTALQPISFLVKHWPFLIGLIVGLSVSVLVLVALGFWM